MKKIQRITEIASRLADTALTDKPVYGDQTFGDGLDCQEKTFQSNGAEQSGTIGGYEALSSDFVAVQSQPCFCHGANVALPAGDHHTLRPSGFEIKPFRQGSWHYAERGTRVYEKLNFFNAPRRTGQVALYVEQSHIKSLSERNFIATQQQRQSTQQQ